LKEELLERIAIVDIEQIREHCCSYLVYFNLSRPHQGINGRIPALPNRDKADRPDFDDLKVKKVKKLSGLVTQFELAA
jgi:hypothetical protein